MPGEAVVRAPGRVNLLGEHIDYHDLDVLPMALARGIGIRFRRRSDGIVRLVNADPRFPPVEVPVRPGLRPDPPGHWDNYVRAAVTAIAPLAPPGSFGGLDGIVDSDLPVASGLSSSSAVVVAVARAVLASHRDAGWSPPDAQRLADLLAAGERYVGTAGGGMDQAAIVGGRPGEVMRVSFAPVRWTSRALPPGWAVIVAHSGIRAEKSGAAREAYNALRERGEHACAVLAPLFGMESRWPALRTARSTGELREAALRHLDPRTAAVTTHLLTEAERVEKGWEALAAGDRTAFGAAMLGSHDSLVRRCGVGHPRLDALVAAAVDAGADGARLTGAGFGGSIVALTEAGRAELLLESLRAANRASGYSAAEAPVFAAVDPVRR